MAAGKLNAAQQRERRARIMLAVLGVVFVGVLALELPKMLGGGHSNPAAAPVTTSTTSSTATSNVANSSSSVATANASSSGASPGDQLVTFSRFAAKDPFRQQVNLSGPGGTSGSAGAGTSVQKSPVAKQPAATLPSVQFSVQPVKQPASGPLVPAALLKVDGKRRIVRLGEVFPAVKPLFRLVSMSQKAIWIKLLGGSFSNGDSTLKIVRDHPVTLANTTAGTRMALGLVRPTTAHPQPKSPSGAAQTSAK